jgi:hypothetical protein
MPAQVFCAKCGKALSEWELSNGHECRRFRYGRWEIRDEVTVVQDTHWTQAGTTTIEEGGKPRLVECPVCHQGSLAFNTILLLWQCLNPACKARVANEELVQPGGPPCTE